MARAMLTVSDNTQSQQQQLQTAAAAVAAGMPAAAAYQASSLVARVSVKLFNCTPGDLPQGLREQLCSWLCATPAGAEGYIRPGCLHLTMQVSSCPLTDPLPSMPSCCQRDITQGLVEVIEGLLQGSASEFRCKICRAC
jgi:hypothetical protein